MSVQTGTIGTADIGDASPPGVTRQQGSPLRIAWRGLKRTIEVRPYEDGITAILLAGMLATIAWSVQLAGWLDGPLTQPTVLIAGLAGAVIARTRLHWSVGHLAGIAIGFVVVFWQAGQSAEGANIVSTSREVWERYFAWLTAAREGGISRDLLPFELMLLAVAWIVAYFSGWVLFRWRSAWFTTLLLGTGMIVNLSYRPGRFEYTLFLFIALAIMLVAHGTSITRVAGWRLTGVRFPAPLRRLSLQYGLMIAAVVVAGSALLPLWEPRSDSLRDVWSSFRDPLRALEEPISRLLPGVKGRGRGPLARFNDSLPFKGAIELSDEAVMFVDTAYPTMHAGRIYTVYTRGGWLTGETVHKPVTEGDTLADRENLKERIIVSQRFQPNHTTDWAMSIGNSLSISRAGASETLAPIEFVLTMIRGPLDPSLPEDLRRFADALRERFLGNEPLESVEAEIRALIPDTLRLIAIRPDGKGGLASVRVGRPEPVRQEQIAFSFDEPVLKVETYTMTQLVSKATDAQLDAAGDEYPASVTTDTSSFQRTCPVGWAISPPRSSKSRAQRRHSRRPPRSAPTCAVSATARKSRVPGPTRTESTISSSTPQTLRARVARTCIRVGRARRKGTVSTSARRWQSCCARKASHPAWLPVTRLARSSPSRAASLCGTPTGTGGRRPTSRASGGSTWRRLPGITCTRGAWRFRLMPDREVTGHGTGSLSWVRLATNNSTSWPIWTCCLGWEMGS